MTVKSNLAVGCALWEWWWNGIQFVNDYDYGRQMQVAMYPSLSPTSGHQSVSHTPQLSPSTFRPSAR